MIKGLVEEGVVLYYQSFCHPERSEGSRFIIIRFFIYQAI